MKVAKNQAEQKKGIEKKLYVGYVKGMEDKVAKNGNAYLQIRINTPNKGEQLINIFGDENINRVKNYLNRLSQENLLSGRRAQMLALAQNGNYITMNTSKNFSERSVLFYHTERNSNEVKSPVITKVPAGTKPEISPPTENSEEMMAKSLIETAKQNKKASFVVAPVIDDKIAGNPSVFTTRSVYGAMKEMGWPKETVTNPNTGEEYQTYVSFDKVPSETMEKLEEKLKSMIVENLNNKVADAGMNNIQEFGVAIMEGEYVDVSKKNAKNLKGPMIFPGQAAQGVLGLSQDGNYVNNITGYNVGLKTVFSMDLHEDFVKSLSKNHKNDQRKEQQEEVKREAQQEVQQEEVQQEEVQQEEVQQEASHTQMPGMNF